MCSHVGGAAPCAPLLMSVAGRVVLWHPFIAGVGRPACRQTCLRLPSPSSRKTSGPAVSPAHQSPRSAAQAMARMEAHRPTRTPTAMARLLPRSSRATGMVQRHQQLQAAMVQQQHQQQAGLTQAPALQQGTAQRRLGTALLPAVLPAATGSSSSLSRRTRLLLLQCPLLVLAGMVQQLATAAARAMVKQGTAATDSSSSNSSSLSRPSRCTSPSALHRQRRLV